MTGLWVEPDVRDSVVQYVEAMTARSTVSMRQLVRWLGVTRSKFYTWGVRSGVPNRHNGGIPRGHWILPHERDAIIAYCRLQTGLGYRRLTYMMLDADVAAVSPATTYRVLKAAGMLCRWIPKNASCKGTGFEQPLAPHQHWHTDIMYVNIQGAIFFLICVLDGFSRMILHHELRVSMTEYDVEICVERAREKYPDAHPRVISDNGSQFTSRDFREFITVAGLTHVRTSINYPQSNGKQERFHKTLRVEAIRKQAYLSIEDARRQIAEYIEHYNNTRLHSALNFIAPRDVLEGRQKIIIKERQIKLDVARLKRIEYCQALSQTNNRQLSISG